MRRGLVMVGIWAVAVVVAVAIAFAAVNRVASGVAPHDSARLSQSAIDDALAGPSTTAAHTTTTRRPLPTTAPSSPTTSTTNSTSPTGTTPTTTGTTRTTLSTPAISVPPPTTAPASPTTTEAPPTTAAPGERNTVTTSQGGTVFTRCSSPDAIVYVAAVPRSGYQRTVDIESPQGIRQSFQSANHVSRIELECSDGAVHAQVEEEPVDE